MGGRIINMDIRIITKEDLVVLHKSEIKKETLDRCFREYSDMVRIQNTVFVVDDYGIFVGIVTLYDYLHNQKTGDFINIKCKKVICDNKESAMAKAWNLKQEFDSLKIIPVVNSHGILLYGMRFKDTERIENNVRNFEFWFRNNHELLQNQYNCNHAIYVIGEEPFQTVYAARLLKKYFGQVKIFIIGDKEWIFRERDVSEQIFIADIKELSNCDSLISVDVELYGINAVSIVTLSNMMSEYVTREYYDETKEKRDIMWVHIGDILTPLEGKITAVQLFIISRVLDVERRRDGKPFYWQNRFNEFFWPEMSKEAEQMMEKRVELLIRSLKKRGFAPNTSAGSITEYPFGMNDGAHRTAFYTVYAPNSFLPYFIGNKSLTDSFWPFDGESFFLKAGLPIEELEKLRNRYMEMLEKDEVRTSITGYIEKKYFKIFEIVIKNYGQITEICFIKLQNIDFVVFRIKLKKQKLILVKKSFSSKYVDRLTRDLRIRTWGGVVQVASSVSLSVKMENDLEKECMQELLFEPYAQKKSHI